MFDHTAAGRETWAAVPGVRKVAPSSTGRELSTDLSIKGDVQVARGMVRCWEQATHATATKSLTVVRLLDIRLGKQDWERANDA